MYATGCRLKCPWIDRIPFTETRSTMNSWVAALVRQLLSSISPQIRKALTDFVGELEKQAKETPNVWDDILVGILKTVLVIP